MCSSSKERCTDDQPFTCIKPGTMNFWSTAKVQAKCKLKYWRISDCLDHVASAATAPKFLTTLKITFMHACAHSCPGFSLGVCCCYKQLAEMQELIASLHIMHAAICGYIICNIWPASCKFHSQACRLHQHQPAFYVSQSEGRAVCTIE